MERTPDAPRTPETDPAPARGRPWAAVFIDAGCRFQDQGGITISDDAVVGAGSVVTKDVPARTVAVGSPARVVRTIAD